MAQILDVLGVEGAYEAARMRVAHGEAAMHEYALK